MGLSSPFINRPVATALLKALYKYKRNFIEPHALAEMACHIELDLLKEPIGKQDQFIAAFGGVTAFDFRQDDVVEARSLNVSDETLDLLRVNAHVADLVTRDAQEALPKFERRLRE